MFLPIGDTPNPRNYTAWVTWSLIAVNVIVYLAFTLPLSGQPVDLNDPALAEYLKALAPRLGLVTRMELTQLLSQTSAYDLFTFAHGYKPGLPEVGDLFFSLFLHGGFLHLAGNMLFLWIFGDNVEQRLGRLGYLLTYLATGAAATLTFALFDWGSMIPLVGASGAISGVIGLYFLLFPRNKVKVLVVLVFFFDVWLLPARWVVAFYVLVDNLLPFLAGAQSGVAYGAHLGGFAAGLAVAWVGRSLSWRWPWARRRLPTEKSADRPAAKKSKDSSLEGLSRAIEAGRKDEALSALQGLRTRDLGGLDPAHCAILSAWVQDAGHPAVAARMLRRCLSTQSGSGELARVYLALGLLRLDQGQQAAAYQHLLSVFDHDPDPATRTRASQALDRIDLYRKKKK